MTGSPPAPLTPATIAELEELKGVLLGPTGWHGMTQGRVDAFAEATEDRQWIHVDPARAATTPFGGTIAHGLFTLSLGPMFMEQLLSFERFAHVLNYGYEKVRFPAPVPVGSQLRLQLTIADVVPIGDAAQVTFQQQFEASGVDKPVCVASSVARFFEAEPGGS